MFRDGWLGDEGWCGYDRREHFVRGKTIKEIVRDLHVSRNGAPFKDWVLPASLERVRRKTAPGGDRQMVEILSAVLERFHVRWTHNRNG